MRIAERQFGVISVSQLRALGLSPKEIRGRVKTGLLHRLYPEVFAVGHRRLGTQPRLIAALLTCGPGSFLSHRTAAALWGLRAMNLRRTEVTLATTGAPRRRGIVVHRTRDTRAMAEVCARDGLRFSSVPRLLVELAPRETPAELDRLITQAVRKRVLNLQALEEALHRHARRPGMSKLKPALRGYRPRPDRKSNLERAFDELIAGTEIPEPLKNVTIGGWEIDCYWPEHKLAVELDGGNYHRP